MSIEPLTWRPAHPQFAPSSAALRRAAATALHGASRALQGLALRLAQAPARPVMTTIAPVLEFHAEAGAPEGALYVDGLLLAQFTGVRRL